MPNHAIRDADRVSELALSIAWHAGLTREITTTAGERLAIVFPGHWAHGHDPDFRDAMLEGTGGRLLAGGVELHHRASDWTRHGHHTDPAYNDVVLHVVTDLDVAETRRLDGRSVPIAELRVSDAQLQAVEQGRPALWDHFGGDICAPDLSRNHPERVRQLLRHLGDTRFDQRVVRFEAELALTPPSAVLLPALFDAFGYSRNRKEMRRLAAALDWPAFAARLHRLDRGGRTRLTRAVMLGVGGWMPLSPAHASLARLAPADVAELEATWSSECSSWELAILPGTIWDTGRVRPANHPVARVSTMAAVLGAHGDNLVPVLIGAIRDGLPVDALLRQLAESESGPPLGTDRAIAIAASVVLPFAVALARSNRDDALEDDALRGWIELPAGAPSQSARRAPAGRRRHPHHRAPGAGHPGVALS